MLELWVVEGTVVMGGTFQATASFQDSDFIQKAIKNGVGMHFECHVSPFRIQTLTQSHPYVVLVDNEMLMHFRK